MKCKICGAEIPKHYTELVLSIQPRIIKDGNTNFWDIDAYRNDTVRVNPVCENCTVIIKDMMYGDETGPMSTMDIIRLITVKLRIYRFMPASFKFRPRLDRWDRLDLKIERHKGILRFHYARFYVRLERWIIRRKLVIFTWLNENVRR